jgi:hypothetical protein
MMLTRSSRRRRPDPRSSARARLVVARLALVAAASGSCLLGVGCGGDPPEPVVAAASSSTIRARVAAPDEATEAEAVRAATGLFQPRPTLLQMRDDPADLRPEARAQYDVLLAGKGHPSYWDPGIEIFSYSGLPSTIRVWRRSLGGTDSCTGQVDVIAFETYVKGVLPAEWYASWKAEALEAGSLAIRTYAAYWVAKGGKYKCADICDTSYSQVYKETTSTATNKAVDATAGQVLVSSSGNLIFSEYSAENGDPTADGISDSVCNGKTVSGHGRGMCQWGTQRWALQGKAHAWIASHYYPSATIWPSSVGDGGTSPKKESGTAHRDGGSPSAERSASRLDGGAPPADGASGSDSAGGSQAVQGSGCSLAPGRSGPTGDPAALPTLLLALALLLPRSSRRGPEHGP